MLSHKGKTSFLTLSFDESDFRHLAGFHKLTDLKNIVRHRANLLEGIREGELSFETIAGSAHYQKIETRIQTLGILETALDAPFRIYQYDPDKVVDSRIYASHLLIAETGEGAPIHLFLNEYAKEEAQSVSLFRRSGDYYTAKQRSYTILRKEKWDRKTGEIRILYDRLAPKPTI